MNLIAKAPLWLGQGFSDLIVKPNSYNHVLEAFGGCWSAQFTLGESRLQAENWLEEGLGRHIETRSDVGYLRWSGFVNSVTHYVLIALGRQRALTTTFIIGLTFNVIANALFIPIWSYRASAVIHILSEMVLLTAFTRLMRRDLPPVPWVYMLWRPGVAALAMGLVGWMLYDSSTLLATGAALGAYAATLWVLGIAQEPDMQVIRDLLPRRDKRAPSADR